MVKQEIF